MGIESNRNLRHGAAYQCNWIQYISIRAFNRDWGGGIFYGFIERSLIFLLSYCNESSHLATDRFILYIYISLSISLSTDSVVSMTFFTSFINFVIIGIERCGKAMRHNHERIRIYSKKSSKYDKWSRSIAEDCCCFFSRISHFFFIQVSFERIHLIDSNTIALHALAIRIEIWNESYYIEIFFLSLSLSLYLCILLNFLLNWSRMKYKKRITKRNKIKFNQLRMWNVNMGKCNGTR